MVCLVSPFDCIPVDRALGAVIILPLVGPRLCTVPRHYCCTILFSNGVVYKSYALDLVQKCLVHVQYLFDADLRSVLVLEPEGSQGLDHKSGLLWSRPYTCHMMLYTVRMFSKFMCLGSNSKCTED
jgi:hypothetical protein